MYTVKKIFQVPKSEKVVFILALLPVKTGKRVGRKRRDVRSVLNAPGGDQGLFFEPEQTSVTLEQKFLPSFLLIREQIVSTIP